MIYIPKEKGTHTLTFPNNYPNTSWTGAWVLELIGTTSQSVEPFSLSKVSADSEYLFMNVTFTSDGEIPTGEYKYNLCAGEKIVASGVAFFGTASDFVNRKEYEQTIEYEQYES